MATIVRVSRFTGGSCSLRRIFYPNFHLAFRLCQNARVAGSRSLFVNSRRDTNFRYNSTVTASVASDNSKNLLKSKRDFVIESSSATALDELLKQLDEQVRRWGRVDKEQIMTLLDIVSKSAAVSTQQSIMIFRCTGSLLVKETLSERNAIFEEACKRLKSLGAEVNIQVYNAMLRTKLENEQFFLPAQILAEVETEKNLVPNRVTYQLLLSGFCEKGDIEGASTILEHMKSQNLPINEIIFNALIKGYMRKGDFAEAKAVLSKMREIGLDPKSETYEALMCGFAENGDMNGVKQALEEASTANVQILPRHLFHVITSLVNAKHEDGVDEILEYIRHKLNYKYNHDALNCIFQLLSTGQDDVALKVNLSMDRISNEDREVSSPLVRMMIIKGRPVDKVIEVWNKLFAEKLFTGVFEDIAMMALRYQHSGYVIQVLQKMKEKGFNVKQHYFWPVLKDAVDNKDVKNVFEAVGCLINCTKGTDDVIVGTIFSWAVKPLLLKGEKIESIISGLKAAGVNDSEIEMLQTATQASNGNFTETEKLISEGMKFSPGIFKAELVNGFLKSNNDAKGLAKVLAAANRELKSFDINSGILTGILTKKTVSKATAENLIDEWSKEDLKLLNNFKPQIKRQLSRIDVAPEFQKKVDDLIFDSSKQEQVSLTAEEMKHASIEELESLLENTKNSKTGRILSLEKWLLSKYCKAGMAEKAENLKSKLDGQGFVYSGAVLRDLGTLSARVKGNLKEALAFKQQLEAEHPSYKPYAVFVLHIANLQLADNKFDDAINTLKSYTSLHSLQLEESGFSEGYQLSDVCIKLLKTCEEQHFDIAKCLQLCDAIFDGGYLKRGSFDILKQLMNCHLKKEDPDAVLTALEYCVTKFNKAPQFSDFFQLLILKEDADRLQKAVDLMTMVYGEVDVLLYLTISFIECNKTRQARKVLETPGLRAVMKPLISGCERLLFLDKSTELEQLVEMTKSMVGIDRDEMFLQLMRLHAKKKDTKKMLEVFSLYEEEGVKPRDRTLRYVAKVLRSVGESVPFKEPLPVIETISSDDFTATNNMMQVKSNEAVSNDIDSEAEKAIANKDISKVMELKKQMDAEGNEQSIKFVINLTRYLLHSRNNKMFRSFVYHLAESCDINGLLAIRKLKLTKDTETFVNQRLCVAYLNGNKIEEMIDYLRENPERLSNFVTTSILQSLAEKRPDLFENLISMIETYSEKSQNIKATTTLYDFYMLSGQKDKIERLFKKIPTLKDGVRLSFVCANARRLQKEDVLKYTIEIHQNPENCHRLIVPYNHLLLLKCDQGDFSSILECYQSALKSGLTFDDLWIRSLQMVQSLFEKNGQPLPWKPGMLEKKLKKATTNREKKLELSDVSSGSDSETEAKTKTSS